MILIKNRILTNFGAKIKFLIVLFWSKLRIFDAKIPYAQLMFFTLDFEIIILAFEVDFGEFDVITKKISKSSKGVSEAN